MTTYNLITRAGWNARPPKTVVPLTWAKVDKFIVHYSGAVRTQSVRSIQDYCMDSKGHSDIDYNDIVRGKDRNIGRGVNVGSHTLGLNSSSYGVCIIGNDGDATDDDFRTVREIYDELTVKLGRQLRKLGHRTAMPPGYTTCLGDEIQAWIDRGMPYPEDDMYEQSDRDTATADTYRLLTVLENKPAAEYQLAGEGTPRNEPNLLKVQLDRIEKMLGSGGSATGITEDQLRAIIRDEISKTKLS